MLTRAAGRQREKPWRAKAQAVIAITIGCMSFIAGLLLGFLDYQLSSRLSAYQAAPACAVASDAAMGSSCQYTGSATVTGSSRQTTISIQLAFASIPGRTFTTAFATENEPTAGSVATGAVVTAKLWDGRVTRVGDVDTVDDPGNRPSPHGLLLGAAVFGCLGILGIVWGIQFARSAWPAA